MAVVRCGWIVAGRFPDVRETANRCLTRTPAVISDILEVQDEYRYDSLPLTRHVRATHTRLPGIGLPVSGVSPKLFLTRAVSIALTLVLGSAAAMAQQPPQPARSQQAPPAAPAR